MQILLVGDLFPAVGTAVDPSQFHGGTQTSRRLAAAALRESTDGDNQGGWCSRDVGGSRYDSARFLTCLASAG